MKRILLMALAVLLIGIASLSVARPASAGLSSPPQWLTPAWKDKTDTLLGQVAAAYITGTTWTLKLDITNDVHNSTLDPPPPNSHMDIRVYRVSVWFDWGKFYNTTLDVVIKHDDIYAFTVNGTTEQISIASNLYSHVFKVFVEFSFAYNNNGASITESKTWLAFDSNVKFAVLSQDQYDADQAALKYTELKGMVGAKISDPGAHVSALDLSLQADQEYSAGRVPYSTGDFSGAKQHYNNAWSLLNQSWATYAAFQTKYDDNKLARALAEVDAIEANASAILIGANALATGTIMTSFAFVFFGLGFIFFGVAAIIYARRRSPKAA